MLLILSSNILVLSYKQLTISYSYPRIIIYKLVSAILVSPPNPKVIALNISVVVAAFSGMLLTYRSSLL